MALSQADFYAYSRATGAPLPESPGERAEMAPEVLNFRRNQLKAPTQQGPDPLSVGIGVGLALAGAGGLAFGASRLMRGSKQSATAGVRQANLAEMAAPESPVRRVATEPAPEPSKVVSEPEYVSPYRKELTYQDLYPSRFEYPRISPETIQARRQASAQSVAAAREAIPSTYQLELGGEVFPTLRQLRSSEFGPNLTQTRREALGFTEETATTPKFSFIKSSIPLTEAPNQLNLFSPRSYLEQTGSLAPAEDLTSVQQQSLPQVIDQKINAVESGEDQMTGRIKQQLQRNEDLDLTQVELLEEVADANYLAGMEQDEPITQVASRLPDGLPVDQTEIKLTKPKFIFRERVFEKPGIQLQEEAVRTQRYVTPTPVSVVGQYPPTLEKTPSPYAKFPGTFGSSTGESIVVSPVDPAAGLTNIRRGGVEFTAREARLGEEGRPGRFTVLPQGTTTEGRVFTGPSTPTLSADEVEAKLAEMKTMRETQIQKIMSRGLSEARARRNVPVTKSQLQALEADLPTFSPEDVMSRTGVKSYGSVEEAERFSEEQASRSGQIKALEEGGFLEEQVDPGELRGALRQASPGVMIRPASRTSYRGMTGRPGVGIYGEQAPGTAGTPGFGAGAVEASKIIKTEGEERGVTTPRKFIPGVDDPAMQTPEGFVYTEEAMTQPTQARGGYRRYGTQPPTRPETRLEAFDVARQLRQLQQSGRPEEAQAFLDKIMEERGISALGQSQPLRQQMSRRGKFGV